MDRSRFLKFYLEKNIFIFLPVNVNSTPLDPVIRLYLFYSTFSCILLVKAAGPCFPLVDKNQLSAYFKYCHLKNLDVLKS
jgi:hypothetical protein